MLGTLRLALAGAVALSHSGIDQKPVWIGVIAVVIFFIISGYAMTALLEIRFSQSGSAKWFFAERFVRLAPQYYFWLSIGFGLALLTAWMPVTIPDHPVAETAAYVFVFPLGMQFYLFQMHMFILPQATSLGIEIAFYIFSPFFLGKTLRSWVLFSICILIFILSSLNIINNNLYTYYSIPGPMVFYIIGSWIYLKNWRSLSVGAGILLLILASHITRHFELELLIGVILGIPSVMILAPLRSSSWDRIFGNASYGCFLCHVSIMYMIKGVFGLTELTPFLRYFAVALAMFIGLISYYLIERPTVRFKKRLSSDSRLHKRSVRASSTIAALPPEPIF